MFDQLKKTSSNFAKHALVNLKTNFQIISIPPLLNKESLYEIHCKRPLTWYNIMEETYLQDYLHSFFWGNGVTKSDQSGNLDYQH